MPTLSALRTAGAGAGSWFRYTSRGTRGLPRQALEPPRTGSSYCVVPLKRIRCGLVDAGLCPALPIKYIAHGVRVMLCYIEHYLPSEDNNRYRARACTLRTAPGCYDTSALQAGARDPEDRDAGAEARSRPERAASRSPQLRRCSCDQLGLDCGYAGPIRSQESRPQ
eukprot:scaffold30042_cov65-Phaeocystis_antarctica.AAC.4